MYITGGRFYPDWPWRQRWWLRRGHVRLWLSVGCGVVWLAIGRKRTKGQ